MSSKHAPETSTISKPDSAGAAKPWSLAARLTAWYAGSAFTLVVATAGFLYWTSIRNLDREDDRLLGDRARVLLSVLENQPGNVDAIRREVFEEWDAHQRTQLHVRILGRDGQTLVETPGMRDFLPPGVFPKSESDSGVGTEIVSETGGLFRVLTVQAPSGSRSGPPDLVQIAMDRSLETELAADYSRNLLAVLIGGLLASAGAGYAIAHRGIRPIHGITAIANRITSANLNERMSPSGLPAELHALAGTINNMLDRLEDSFTRLSRFSADIAHELRTPIASLRGGVEVALGQPRNEEEYREILHSNLEECGRLSHLIDRLLFLARAENPRTHITRERCELAAELAKLDEFYQAAAAEAKVRLVMEVEPVASRADVDRSLFQRAVGNLIANALAHTPAHGTVTVQASANETSAIIKVRDTGRGLAASHLPHVFDRFYRGDQARSSRTGNVGLGLAIVRSIVELHEGSVAIASEEGHGACVTMVFPKKVAGDAAPGQS
jgi:two-component system heavy metal sensor histidine kinase CusS